MVDVVMPQMGESIVEGTLTRWLKKPGEQVQRDEPLFEISTDKVDTEIPSPAAGTLSEVLVEQGATVSINTVVARIEDGAGGAAAPPKAEAQADGTPSNAGTTSQGSTPAVAPPAAAPGPAVSEPALQPKEAAQGAGPYPAVPEDVPTGSTPGEQIAAKQLETPAEAENEGGPQGPLSPLVRKLAKDYGIDLKQVRGTGAGSRITKQDVEEYMSAQGAKTLQQPAAAGAGPYPAEPAPAPVAQAPAPQPQQAASAPAPAPAAPQPQAPPSAPPAAGMAKTRTEPLSTMRQKIAEHMVYSVSTSPHVTTVHKVDMTKVAKLREKNKGEVQTRYGFGLTFLPFITRAAVTALQSFPILNASIDGNNVVYHNEINMGIAVALPGGLIVPVIRNADEKNIIGLQRSIVDLAARARSRQLKPDEIQGGTFTITNYGSGGSIIGTPIINQPQVAILGVGAIEKIPVVVEDAIAIRSICHLSLSFDHRLIDGALADEFVSKIKSVLQEFAEQVL